MSQSGATPVGRRLVRELYEQGMQRMNTDTINKQVQRFITRNYLLGRDDAFSDSDSFLEHGIIDSTGILELIAFLQETYGIVVEDEELLPENLDSVENVAAYVSRKLNGALETAELRY